jgi:hypothetical protein
MSRLHELIPIIELLVGESARNNLGDLGNQKIFENGRRLGYSQFNEIMLLIGFDRVTQEFFQFLVDNTIKYKSESSIESIEKFNQGVDRYIKIALLEFGSIKFAYQTLSKDVNILEKALENRFHIPKTSFTDRHDPINRINPISKNKTHLLGYISSEAIKKGSSEYPLDEYYQGLMKDMEEVKKIAIQNQTSYLTYDHMDVYVATSMRLPHEYFFVNQLTKEIFESDYLKDLKLRYFDPTQAFCEDRLDKGLSEALMLKRAACTLYLVQESDTLGKDSELASTLAQGKPVIAYVPKGDKTYVDTLLSNLKELHPEKQVSQILIEQLQIFAPELAWQPEHRGLFDCSETQLLEILYQKVDKHYNKRAETLMDKHPLGVQVNLASGVANGVLVVRDVDSCANLIENIIRNKMDFKIERCKKNGNEYLLLREAISNCIFRLKSGDPLLTTTFWNYYIN